MNTKPLLIVESPSKAKTISKYLDGDYTVLACVGHIKDLPRKELGVDTENDFTIKEEILPDKKSFIKELKSLSKTAPEIVIATDPDREGEAIAAHIASEVGNTKISRVQFTEITKEGVEEGMTHPSSLNEDLIEAQRSRRIIDRLIGYKVSPVLWSTLQKNMNFVEVTLSAGRVQSAALKMIVERERLRAAFTSAHYYDLKAELMTEKMESFHAVLNRLDGKKLARGKDFNPDTGQLKNENVLLLTQTQAEALVNELKPGPWLVKEVTEKIQNSHPKPPFTTSTLQQEAARKLRFSARKTMRTAQQLYEAGYITYMRTDSTQLSQEGLQGARTEIQKVFGADYLPDKPKYYATKVKNAQEAHEAIRPAGPTIKSARTVSGDLGSEAGNLYDLIRKRTLASQMKSAKLKQISATIENQKAEFRATGKVILFPGYMAVYVEGTDDPKKERENKERILPPLSTKERLGCEELTSEEHITKPPARYTEASLVKDLENRGIGRPSTFASILDTIQRRTYVSNKKGILTPSFLGFAVTQLLENHFNPLVDSEFTAKMEDGLDAISRGEKHSHPFISDFYFGADSLKGLETMLDEKVDIAKACTIPVLSNKVPIDIRIGRYGPYLQQGEKRRNIPLTLAMGDINPDKAIEILSQEENEDSILGIDEKTGESVVLKTGPYGPYVQLGETKSRKSIPKGTDLAQVDLDLALRLLALPRSVGHHPETGDEIFADYGRYGPYIKVGKLNKSLPSDISPLNVSLDSAVEILKQSKQGSTVLKSLGEHTTTGETLTVKTGRYGPYVTDGKTNSSLPKNVEPDSLTLTEAVDLIDKRRAAGPRKKRRKKKK